MTSGEVGVATEPHQVDWLREAAHHGRARGLDSVFLDRDEVRASSNSPSFLAGVWKRDHCAMVDPARLAWGLKAWREARCSRPRTTPVTRFGIDRRRRAIGHPVGPIDARRVVLGTNGFTPLVRSIRRYVVPVYDYVLVTEPLSDARAAERDRLG